MKKNKFKGRRRGARIESLEARQMLDASAPGLISPDFSDLAQAAVGEDTVEYTIVADGQPVVLNVLDDLELPANATVTLFSRTRLGSFVEFSENPRAIVYTPFPGSSGGDAFAFQVEFDGATEVHQVSIDLRSFAEPRTFEIPESADPTELTLVGDLPANYAGPGLITSISSSSRGSRLELAADQKSVIYTPADGLHGTDQFAFVVDETFSATADIEIVRRLADDTYQRQFFGGVIRLPVLSNDILDGYDGPGEITSARLLVGVGGENEIGQVEVSEDRLAVLFTPSLGFVGRAEIEYIVDGQFKASARLTIPTVAFSDRITIDVNSTDVAIDVLANDLGAGFITNVESLDPSPFGSIEIADDGLSLVYSAPPSESGFGRFRYVTNLGYSATLNVTVTDPVRNDRYSVIQDSVNNVLAVLANDFTVDDGSHSITNVTDAQFGSVEISPDGSHLLYTPNENFIGTDRVVYTVDGDRTAEVAINVASPARHDSYRIRFIPGQTFLLDVLSNEFHRLPKGFGSQITSITADSSDAPTFEISDDGQQIEFTPIGSDFYNLTYVVDGRYVGKATVNATSLIEARSDVTSVTQNGSVLIDVLANDRLNGQLDLVAGAPVVSGSEYSGPQIITSTTATVAGGVVTISDDGRSLSYTPPQDFVGYDSFGYVVDNQFNARVSVNVIKHARDDLFSVAVNSTEVELGLLRNDPLTDYSGAGLITQLSSPTSGATVRIADDGQSIFYTPAASFVGVDSLTYTLDGQQTGLVTVHVVESADQLFEPVGDLEQFREFLIERALEEHSFLFGRNAGGTTFPPLLTARSSEGFSETNTQEAGVDEADLVENDGEHLYFISGSTLVIAKAHPVSDLAEVANYEITGTPVGMYLHNGQLTIISRTRSATSDRRFDFGGLTPVSPIRVAADSAARVDTASSFFFGGFGIQDQTTVTILDVSDPTAIAVVKQTQLDGRYRESRSVDGAVSVVIDSGRINLPRPNVLQEESLNSIGGDDPTGGTGNVSFRYETRNEYAERIRSNFDNVLAQLLPTFRTTLPDGIQVEDFLALPTDFRRVIEGDNDRLISIVEFNSENLSVHAPEVAAVMTGATDVVYATRNHIYLMGATYENGRTETTIRQFEWADSGSTRLVAIGQVEGRLLNQFSADEHNGQLRLVMSVFRTTPSASRFATDVVVLQATNGLLQPVGSLLDVSRGNAVQAVRLEGDWAYISSADRTSPLSIIDLSDPSNIHCVASIRTAGQPDYIQFLDDNHLVVLGSNGSGAVNSPNGAPLLLSLFNVSDPANPVLLDRDVLPYFSTSLAQADHHAFGWYPDQQVLAIPSAQRGPSRLLLGSGSLSGDSFLPPLLPHQPSARNELVTFNINLTASADESAISTTGFIAHEREVRRSARIGNTLYSLGDGAIKATDINEPGSSVTELPISFSPAPLDLIPFFIENRTSEVVFSQPPTAAALEASLTDLMSVEDGTLNIRAGELRFPRIVGFVDGNDFVFDFDSHNDSITAGLQQQRVSTDGISRIVIELGDDDSIVDMSRLSTPVVINGGQGNDLLIGSRRDDVIVGGTGDDIILGAAGHDRLQGDEGNDMLRGHGGGDFLDGGAGIDKLFGGAGRNRFRDEVGGTLTATNRGFESSEGDLVRSGGNIRSLVLLGRRTRDVFDLSAVSSAEVTVHGGGGDDIVIGSQRDDYITGGAGDDILLGAAGNDFMLGGEGRDQLKGNGGHDHLEGGQGSDRLDGGAGLNETVRQVFPARQFDPLDAEVDRFVGSFRELREVVYTRAEDGISADDLREVLLDAATQIFPPSVDIV